jgi:hypothetical protein
MFTTDVVSSAIIRAHMQAPTSSFSPHAACVSADPAAFGFVLYFACADGFVRAAEFSASSSSSSKSDRRVRAVPSPTGALSAASHIEGTLGLTSMQPYFTCALIFCFGFGILFVFLFLFLFL